MIKKHCNDGSALSQYGIIIVLVALALIPLFFLVGGNIVSYFTSFSNSIKAGSTQNGSNLDPSTSNLTPELIDKISTGTVKAGELNGSPDNPIRKCVNNKCTIDYGSVILNGIPADFNEVIQAGGASGGTDTILKLLEQLANQMKDNPDKFGPEQLADLEKLMAEGKNIVKTEKYYQDFVKQYGPELTAYNDEKNQIFQNIDADKYSEYLKAVKNNQASSYGPEYAQAYEAEKALRTKYDSLLHNLYNGNDSITMADGSTQQLSMNMAFYMLNPQTAIYDNSAVTSLSNSAHKKELTFEDFMDKDLQLSTSVTSDFQLTPSGQYLQELNKIVNNDKTDSSIKQICQILSKEVFNMFKDTTGKAGNVVSIMEDLTSKDQSVSQITDNKASETTRLDLAIMCGSNRGQYNDDNVTCQQYNK